MTDRGRERPTMQYGKNNRIRGRVRVCRVRVGRVGVCLASVSSILVLAGPTSASAHEVSSTYQAENRHFSLNLTGAEVPGGGDPNGKGSATLDLKPQEKTACFTINWNDLSGDVTALHLHVATRGSEGPHAIDFFNNQNFPGKQYNASGCISTTPETIKAVIAHPENYYLNVHSTAFSNGALRGQLN